MRFCVNTFPFSLDLWPHERKRILPEFPRLSLVWFEKNMKSHVDQKLWSF